MYELKRNTGYIQRHTNINLDREQYLHREHTHRERERESEISDIDKQKKRIKRNNRERGREKTHNHVQFETCVHYIYIYMYVYILRTCIYYMYICMKEGRRCPFLQNGGPGVRDTPVGPGRRARMPQSAPSSRWGRHAGGGGGVGFLKCFFWTFPTNQGEKEG